MFYINIIKVEQLSNTNTTVQDSAKNKREQNSVVLSLEGYYMVWKQPFSFVA